MSGGVDSSVVAALLVDQGYDVVGVYMKNWSENSGISNSCPWEEDIAEVEKVAKHLNIQWKVYNFEKEYKERVLDYFFSEYKAGRTPNPDILCNNLIKFDLCATRARAEGAHYLATGHYARRRSRDGFSWEMQGDLGLYTAIDATKDQGYFLQRVSREQLEFALFPLGNLYKSEVRALARHYQLPNAERKDSQGICFIGDIDVRDFIREHLQTMSGDIRDVDQDIIVGKHSGLWFYTIGQRQGIGIASNTEPYFVVGKNASKNELEIARGHNHPLLRKKEIMLHDVHLLDGEFHDNIEVCVSLRYREKPQQATLVTNQNQFKLVAGGETGFWAPAPGQSVLLYEKGELERFQESRKVAVSAGNHVDSITLKENFTRSETLRSVRILGGGYIV